MNSSLKLLTCLTLPLKSVRQMFLLQFLILLLKDLKLTKSLESTAEGIFLMNLQKKDQVLAHSWNLLHLFQVCRMMNKESKTHQSYLFICLQEKQVLFSKVSENFCPRKILQITFLHKILSNSSILISMHLLILNIWVLQIEFLKVLEKCPESFIIINQNN